MGKCNNTTYVMMLCLCLLQPIHTVSLCPCLPLSLSLPSNYCLFSTKFKCSLLTNSLVVKVECVLRRAWNTFTSLFFFFSFFHAQTYMYMYVRRSYRSQEMTALVSTALSRPLFTRHTWRKSQTMTSCSLTPGQPLPLPLLVPLILEGWSWAS